MDKNIKTQIDKIISYFNAGNYKEVFDLSNILLKIIYKIYIYEI